MLDICKDWSKVEALELMSETPIRNLLPKENLNICEIILGRSKPMEIPKAQWSQIRDKDVPDDYGKANFVESYFCVAIDVLHRNKVIQVDAGDAQEYEETIEHISAIHNTVKKTNSLDMALDVGGTVKGCELKAHIGTKFEITKENKYDMEDKYKTVKKVSYKEKDYDREIVFWDLSRVVVLFRKSKEASGSVKMVALDDYYFETYQKTYNYKD